MKLLKKVRFSFTLIFLLSLYSVGVCEENAYPRKVTWGNTSIVLEKKPEKILVSFVNALEILEKLVDEKRIVGIPKMALDPKFSNCVAFAKKIPFVFDTPDMEMIEKCNPEIVILASFNDPKIVELLKTFKRQYIILDKFDTYEDICLTIRFLGSLTDEEEKAEELIKSMDSELKLIQDNWPKTKLRVMSYGYNSYSAGSGTTLHDLMIKAGCENVAASFGIKGHKQVSYEELIKINPDWMVIYSQDADAKEKFLTAMKKNQAFQFVTAFKLEQVIVLSPSLGTSSSQYFVDGVMELSLKMKTLK